MFSWTAERFRARSLRTAALIAPAGPPQALDSRAGDQERDAGSLTITDPPLLMFQADCAGGYLLVLNAYLVAKSLLSSPQSPESALAGRRGRMPRRQKAGGCRRQNRQYCGYFMSALTTPRRKLLPVLAFACICVYSRPVAAATGIVPTPAGPGSGNADGQGKRLHDGDLAQLVCRRGLFDMVDDQQIDRPLLGF